MLPDRAPWASPRPPTPAEAQIYAEILLGARILRPYYSRAIAALTPLTWPGLDTVAVGSGGHLYLDPVWLADLPARQQAGVIAAHEVEHLLRAHADRARVICADPRAWNRAADLEINDDAEAGLLPPSVLYPATEGLLAEEYYQQLPHSGCDGLCGGGSGAGRPLPNELPGGGLSPADLEDLRDQVAQDLQQHVAVHGRGSVPAGALIWADTRCPPVRYDWRRDLRAIVARASRAVARGREDYTWARLSRRQRPGHPLRPGTQRYLPTVGLVVDTSGSMSGLGAEAIAHAEAIARAAGRLIVVACDAAVTSRGSRIPIYWRGGGGTDLRRGITALEASVTDVIVVITDGETPWPEIAPRVPVIVVLVAAAAAAVPPPTWARVVRAYNKESP